MHTIICFIFIVLLASIDVGMAVIVTNDLARADTSNLVEFSESNNSTVSNVLNKYPLFVLDCYVSWCEPCKELNATLYELSDELKDQVAFGSINIEKNEETARRYNIITYPTILFFKNGTLVDSQMGYGSKSELIMRLQMIKPDLNISNVRTNETQTIPMISPSDTMPLRISRNISPNKMQILPGPAPAVFRQFVENASKYNNSSKFLSN